MITQNDTIHTFLFFPKATMVRINQIEYSIVITHKYNNYALTKKLMYKISQSLLNDFTFLFWGDYAQKKERL